MRSTNLSVRLDPYTDRILDSLARETDRSRGSVIRRLVQAAGKNPDIRHVLEDEPITKPIRENLATSG